MESCRMLITFSFMNALTLSGIVYIGRNVSDVLNVVVRPLIATEVLTGVVCFWSICQTLCLQKDIVWKIKVTPIMKSVGVVIFGMLAFHCVAIFYGAPVTESVAETAHFALLMSATTFLPCCLALGPKIAAWIRVFAEYRPDNGVESLVQTTTVCSIVGAWLGAFPIPLDWDRPWQVWPISCVLGTVMGYVGGLVLGSLRLLYQHRLEQKMKLV